MSLEKVRLWMSHGKTARNGSMMAALTVNASSVGSGGSGVMHVASAELRDQLSCSLDLKS
jgi:hypothetical protein